MVVAPIKNAIPCWAYHPSYLGYVAEGGEWKPLIFQLSIKLSTESGHILTPIAVDFYLFNSIDCEIETHALIGPRHSLSPQQTKLLICCIKCELNISHCERDNHLIIITSSRTSRVIKQARYTFYIKLKMITMRFKT